MNKNEDRELITACSNMGVIDNVYKSRLDKVDWVNTGLKWIQEKLEKPSVCN